jgi:hypothetical protein
MFGACLPLLHPENERCRKSEKQFENVKNNDNEINKGTVI